MAIMLTIDEIRSGEIRQTSLPGTEPDTTRLAQLHALRGRKPQKPCDIGLFGDAHKQTEMF